MHDRHATASGGPARVIPDIRLDGYPKVVELPAHHRQIVIPDWRKVNYQQAMDVDHLMDLDKRLSAKGLRDPWMRNEVWRYQHKQKNWSRSKIVLTEIFKGAKWGLLATVVCIGIDKVYCNFIRAPGDDRSIGYRFEEWLLWGSKGKPGGHHGHDAAHHGH